MKIRAPAIDLDLEADESTIKLAVNGIAGKDNPFAILEKDALTYAQTLWTEEGYILQFQEGSIDQHFEFQEPFSATQIIEMLCAYLASDKNWFEDNEYRKVELRTLRYRIGYAIGSFMSNFVKGLKDGRAR